MPEIVLDLLGHPLFLLVVGAFLGRMLIPWITRQWQLSQKELELKSELVARISHSVMRTLMTAEWACDPELSSQSSSAGALLETTYRDWKVESCVVGSIVHAYFPNEPLQAKQIHKKWAVFADDLSKHFKRMSALAAKADAPDLTVATRTLLERKASLIKEILETEVTGWHTRLFGR